MLRHKAYRYGDENTQVPAHLNCAKDIYDRMVKNKDMVALINSDTDQRITYGDLAKQAAAIALSLRRLGVRKGDVINTCGEKGIEMMSIILGIICAGAVFSPTDISYGKDLILHRLQIARPKIVVCSRKAYNNFKSTFDTLDSIEKYLVFDSPMKDGANTQNISNSSLTDVTSGDSFNNLNIDGSVNINSPNTFMNGGTHKVTVILNDLLQENVAIDEFIPVAVEGWVDKLLILFSSGTTGLPKGVPMTHLSFLVNAPSVLNDSFKGKYILNTKEWYHAYGLLYTLAALRVGATVVYTTTKDEMAMLAAVKKYKINVLQVAPTAITALVKSDLLDSFDVTSVEYISSSSMPVLDNLDDALKKRLPNLRAVIQIYGMSEAGSVCSELGAPLGSKPGSSGLPSKGFIIKVADFNTKEPLGPYKRGEICIKGPSVMKQYINVKLDSHDDEGFFRTGDVGYYDEDGYFFIVDRIKDLIKFNDLSIAPAEFEAVLLKHPAVLEAGVVGAKHPQHGEIPVAFVALRPGASATAHELVEHINGSVTPERRLAGGVRFVTELPRGAGGKLDRLELRRLLNNTNEY